MKYNVKSSPIVICFFILLAFTLCELSAFAQSGCPNCTTWTGDGSGTSWFDEGNWSNGVPNILKDAFINNGGTATISEGAATAHSLTLGRLAQDSGTLLVKGVGSLGLPQTTNSEDPPIQGAIYVGYQGRGTLSITDGGTVSCGYGYIAAMNDPNARAPSHGVVTVDGTGSNWTLSGDGVRRLYVGGILITDGGTALLSITNGGLVTVNNPSPNNAGWVGASGTVTGNGTLVLNGSTVDERIMVVNGTVAPAKSLTTDGSLAFNPNSAIVCNVTPQDVNIISAAVDEIAFINGGRLSVNMTGSGFTAGTRFTLLHAGDGIYNFGTFASESINYQFCPTCATTFTPVIEYDYDAGNVNLYLDPNQ